MGYLPPDQEVYPVKMKKTMAAIGLGLSLTFALGACDTDDNGDLNGGDDGVDVTTTTILDETTTSG